MLNIGIFLIILSPYLTALPALALLLQIIRGKLAFEKNPLNIGLFVLSCLALFSGATQMSVKSMLSSAGILLYLAVTIYLQSYIDDEDKAQTVLMKAWKYTCWAALLGIAEKALSYQFDLTWIARFYLNKPIEYIYRIYSTFGNPNIAGAWFAAMILTGVFLFEKNHCRQKGAYGACLAVLVVALLFSGSRGALLGLFAGLVIYAVLTKNKKIRIMLLSVLFVLAVLALLSPEINHPLHGRTHIWEKSMRHFADSPIVGIGTFGIESRINKLHAHNIWVSMLTLYGITGLCAYLWMRFYIYQNLFLLYQNSHSMLPLLAGLQAFLLVHGVVDFILLSPQGGVLFFSACAMIPALARPFRPAYPAKRAIRAEKNS